MTTASGTSGGTPVQYLSWLSAHKGCKGSQGAILKMIGSAIFKYTMYVLKNVLLKH